MTMKKCVITPYQGFDNIHFQESRNSVREKLGGFSEFKKNRFSKNTTDDFCDFHAYYDEENTLEAVEFFNVELILHGEKVFPQAKEKLLSALIMLDSSTSVTEDSIISKKLGLSIYAPSETVESVLIFRRGYYD